MTVPDDGDREHTLSSYATHIPRQDAKNDKIAHLCFAAPDVDTHSHP